MTACIAAHWLPFGIALVVAVIAGIGYGWLLAVRIADRRFQVTSTGRVYIDTRTQFLPRRRVVR